MEDFNTAIKSKFAQQLDAIGLEIANDFKNYLTKNSIKATGNLIDSIRYNINESTSANISLQIIASDYFEYIEAGRKPGKFVPIKPLSEWMKAKGIPEEYLYPINYNIYKYGIKPKPIITNAIAENKQQIIDKLRTEYSALIRNYFKTKLQNDINK